MLEAGVTNAARTYLKMAQSLPGAVKGVGGLAKEVVTGGDMMGHLKRLKPAPRTLFNVSITNQRSYATYTIPLAEIKAIGKRQGGTLNDAVMAMCAGALRNFLAERGGVPNDPLIAGVPVSLREAGDATLNNQVSMMTVSLATDEADPAARFAAIRARRPRARPWSTACAAPWRPTSRPWARPG
jgi:diacylglycerol O-acyltransferase